MTQDITLSKPKATSTLASAPPPRCCHVQPPLAIARAFTCRRFVPLLSITLHHRSLPSPSSATAPHQSRDQGWREIQKGTNDKGWVIGYKFGETKLGFLHSTVFSMYYYAFQTWKCILSYQFTKPIFDLHFFSRFCELFPTIRLNASSNSFHVISNPLFCTRIAFLFLLFFLFQAFSFLLCKRSLILHN